MMGVPMRYLLAAALLCHAHVALASDPVGDAVFIFGDAIADARNEICRTRDQDNAAATEKAYSNWKSVNAKTLEEIGTIREKVDAKLKARAIDPKRKVTMDERVPDYSWGTMAPIGAVTMFYRAAAMTNDATARGQCAQLRAEWMMREPDQQLVDSRAMLQKLLDNTP